MASEMTTLTEYETNKSTLKWIVNADDFGISPGVNQAVQEANEEGGVTHTSILCNGEFIEQAIEIGKERKGKLHVGVHLNLCYGQPISRPEEVSLLVDGEGRFKYGFTELMRLLWGKNRQKVKQQVELEWRNQIDFVLKQGLDVSHVDSHRHIHTIPALFSVAMKLKSEFKISRIRIINESLVHSWRTAMPQCLTNGGLIKYCLLRYFGYCYRVRSNTYFYSILNSCRIQRFHIEHARIPRGFDTVEVMLHPGHPDIDADVQFDDDRERDQLLSPERTMELETAYHLGRVIYD